MKVLVRLSNPLEAYKYTEILERNAIPYTMTGLGIDDSSIEYLFIWVNADVYKNANILVRTEHEYFMKCPNCNAIDFKPYLKSNFILTALTFFTALVTGHSASSLNKNICNACKTIF